MHEPDVAVVVTVIGADRIAGVVVINGRLDGSIAPGRRAALHPSRGLSPTSAAATVTSAVTPLLKSSP